jgi:AraC-like DNA-binding protein
MAMKFPRFDRKFLLLLLALLFLSFLISTIYTISFDMRSGMSLQERADAIAGLIVTSSADDLASYDVNALKKNIESYFSNRDIASVRIVDSSDNELLFFSRPLKGTREHTVTRNIIKEGQRLGVLTMVLTDNSVWENTEKTTELILTSNLGNIWDYNIEALSNSVDSFFRDGNIERITITETSGQVLLNRVKRTMGSDRLTVRKPVQINGRTIGTLEIVFTNHAQEEQKLRKRVQAAATAVLTVIIAILMTLTYIHASRERIMDRVPPGEPEPAPAAIHWSVSATTEDKLKKAIEFIGGNFTRNISREGLASMLGINPDNLGRYFKLYTGEKINDYINRLRVETAAEILDETDKTIVEIAFSVGFENISTFNRAFLKVMNETPTEYRKARKKHSSLSNS